ncbi:LOW QUALITY PROTEIN: hypothetical protein DAPPUDRAFT_305854 [Daphnia pulex]|uniref:Uncharacterized protein n=1 Tax=Daphnia pulex TaxID=6669 RepID=E9GT59_DAPPU|nr:LOW QUALITY PROTEIN: hypothetical protein DAPPUDRAFT_305854 [Daphnia pulex]|eukprot:EFX77328.1 LOW QUALITY PROTEIN: hypothetical protein DAPPUDRAFT_305854 [Daphnia pulex]
MLRDAISHILQIKKAEETIYFQLNTYDQKAQDASQVQKAPKILNNFNQVLPILPSIYFVRTFSQISSNGGSLTQEAQRIGHNL